MIKMVFAIGALFVLGFMVYFFYVMPCPTWLAWIVERDNPFSRINRAATIIEHADLQEGMNVLDAGCGPGRLTIPVARKVGSSGSVVAMDLQKGMLDRVREKIRQAGLDNVTFLHAGVGEGKLERNAYDRILLVTVLGEIKRQEAALKEIFAALKPGGVLSITETLFDPHYQRRETVRALTQRIGFKEKNIFEDWFSFTLNLEKPKNDN